MFVESRDGYGLRQMERRAILGIPLAAAAGIGAWRSSALTAGGAAGAAAVGGAVFCCGPPGASGALLYFFTSSSLLTRLPGAGSERESGGRTLGQVLANGGVAALGSLLYGVRPSAGAYTVIGGALAEAAADTWATEIGTRYGGRPRLVTSGKPVESGADGAVTAVGTLAALVGAGTLAAVHVGSAPAPSRVAIAACCAAGGFMGALLDSLLGATVEARPDGGVAWLGNNEVNGLGTLFGAVAATVLARVLL